jgi:hypothetical protein
MKIRRVVLTEEPYPTCVVSGAQLGYFSPVFEITRDDGTVVYVAAEVASELFKT